MHRLKPYFVDRNYLPISENLVISVWHQARITLLYMDEVEIYLFCYILFISILLYSILFYSILFYSILFYYILFHSILFYSIPFYSIHYLRLLQLSAQCKLWDHLLWRSENLHHEEITVAIYAPMIYIARASRRGLDPRNRELFGTCEMASSR
jgi:hypothetical protein